MTPRPSGTTQITALSVTDKDGFENVPLDRYDRRLQRTEPLVHNTIDRHARNVRNLFGRRGQTDDRGTALADLSRARDQADSSDPRLRPGADASRGQQQQRQQGAGGGSQAQQPQQPTCPDRLSLQQRRMTWFFAGVGVSVIIGGFAYSFTHGFVHRS